MLAGLFVVASVGWLLLTAATSLAAPVNPQSGSIGLEGTVPGAPPTSAATILTPSNGQVFTSIPITVSGLCQNGLLVKVFSNNIFVGSVMCSGGSYLIKIDLFSGVNDLVARMYDALDQASPASNSVSVTFRDAQFAQFGSRVTLSSSYARRGADPGTQLDWPLILSGGQGPYALSVDWGDGKPATLMSVAFAGNVVVKHVYDTAGTYNVAVKATDANGTSAYLQLVGVANGQVGSAIGSSKAPPTRTIILWQPLLLLLPLLVIAFWLGRRHELFTIRRQIERSREQA